MDKFQRAILEYESCRQDIVDLARSIGEAGLFPFDEEGGGGGSRCADQKEDGTLAERTCLGRYWAESMELRDIYECTGEHIETERAELCQSCKEVDRLVNDRKAARQKFGVAKRRISQIGKGLRAA